MSDSQRWGALIGRGVAVGIVLVLLSLPVPRRASLADRVLVFAGRGLPVGPRRDSGPATLSSLLLPDGRRAQEHLLRMSRWAFGAISGDDRALAARLRSAGVADDPAGIARHRLRQVGASASGLAVGLIVLLLVVVGGRPIPSAPAVLVLALAGASGVLVHDHRLTTRVRRRRERMAGELPVAAELLALAIGAGETPAAALARVGRVCSGLLPTQFARAADEARGSDSLVGALRTVAESSAVPSLLRMVDAIAIATDRGTPLADVLRAQAADLRAESARALLEGAGRREIAMLVPVVFLILPTVVVVALYPGWQTLQLVTP